MCNNAPLGVVLAAIGITGKLILNNEGRQKSFTWPHYGNMKSNFMLENKGFSSNVLVPFLRISASRWVLKAFFNLLYGLLLKQKGPNTDQKDFCWSSSPGSNGRSLAITSSEMGFLPCGLGAAMLLCCSALR